MLWCRGARAMITTCSPAELPVFCGWLPGTSAISVFSTAKDGAGEMPRFIPPIVVVDEHADRAIVVARTPIIAEVKRNCYIRTFRLARAFLSARERAERRLAELSPATVVTDRGHAHAMRTQRARSRHRCSRQYSRQRGIRGCNWLTLYPSGGSREGISNRDSPPDVDHAEPRCLPRSRYSSVVRSPLA